MRIQSSTYQVLTPPMWPPIRFEARSWLFQYRIYWLSSLQCRMSVFSPQFILLSSFIIKLSLLKQCIDGCSLDDGSASNRLKLLQDICSLSGLLPEMYWVKNVSRGRRVAAGGEATVYKALYQNSNVVLREFHPPPHNDWTEAGGRQISQVSKPQTNWIRFIVNGVSSNSLPVDSARSCSPLATQTSQCCCSARDLPI